MSAEDFSTLMQKNKRKKHIILVTIILIFLVVVAAVLYYFFQKVKADTAIKKEKESVLQLLSTPIEEESYYTTESYSNYITAKNNAETLLSISASLDGLKSAKQTLEDAFSGLKEATRVKYALYYRTELKKDNAPNLKDWEIQVFRNSSTMLKSGDILTFHSRAEKNNSAGINVSFYIKAHSHGFSPIADLVTEEGLKLIVKRVNLPIYLTGDQKERTSEIIIDENNNYAVWKFTYWSEIVERI